MTRDTSIAAYHDSQKVIEKLVEALEFYEKRDRCLPIEISPAKEALKQWKEGGNG